MALFGKKTDDKVKTPTSRAEAVTPQPEKNTASGSNFVEVARTRDIRAGQIRELNAGNYKICMTKVNNSFYAFDAFCPHQGWMLWAGEMRGETIRCDKHRWLFSVCTGETLAPTEMPVHLPIYPVKIEEEKILVDLAAIEAANRARKKG